MQFGRSLLGNSFFSFCKGLRLPLLCGLLSGGLAPAAATSPAAVVTTAAELSAADSALALLFLFIFLIVETRPDRQDCLLCSAVATAGTRCAASCLRSAPCLLLNSA